MPGTKIGGKKAVETTKAKHGDDFYVKIGTLGGSKSRNGGFYVNRELAAEAGRKGGKKSRRGAIDQYKAQERLKAKEAEEWRRENGL